MYASAQSSKIEPQVSRNSCLLDALLAIIAKAEIYSSIDHAMFKFY